MVQKTLLLFAFFGALVFVVSLVEARQRAKSNTALWAPPNYTGVWGGGIAFVFFLIIYLCTL